MPLPKLTEREDATALLTGLPDTCMAGAVVVVGDGFRGSGDGLFAGTELTEDGTGSSVLMRGGEVLVMSAEAGPVVIPASVADSGPALLVPEPLRVWIEGSGVVAVKA